MDGMTTLHVPVMYDILDDKHMAWVNGRMYVLPKSITNDRPGLAFPYVHGTDKRGGKYAKEVDVLKYGRLVNG